MRRSGGPGVNKILLLSLWLVAGCVSYAVQLHVTVAHAEELHAVASHHEHHDDPGHSADEHGISNTADDAFQARARVQGPIPFPTLALLPNGGRVNAALPSEVSTIDPHPRGHPQAHRSFSILRL
jgi:hypothetical protein